MWKSALLSIPVVLFAGLKEPASAYVDAERGCPLTSVSVISGTNEEFDLICGAVARAAELLGRCELQFPRSARIQVHDGTLSSDGLLVHGDSYSATAQIRLVSLAQALALRVQQPSYLEISPATFYAGIVVHELAHLAFAELQDAAPLPYAASEYVAAAFQVASYEAGERARFLRSAPAPGSGMGIFTTMLNRLDPETFAGAAYWHFEKHGCGIVHAIAQGNVRFPLENDE